MSGDKDNTFHVARMSPVYVPPHFSLVPTVVENGSNLCKKRDVCAGEPSLFHSHQKLAFLFYRRYKYISNILCWLGGGEKSIDGVLRVC